VVEHVTSVIPRERPRSNIVPQPQNFALPIQMTVTPRKRPSASNPQTPVSGTAVELSLDKLLSLAAMVNAYLCVVERLYSGITA